MKKDILTNKNNNANALLYADIKIGMEVMNEYGDIGIITECDDPHNILVEYGNGGKGLYCLVPNCEDNTVNLYICI